jgi:hypothetical protein
MPTPIMSIHVGAGGHYVWNAMPGDEIIDPIKHWSIDRIDSGENVPFTRELTILRDSDGSLLLPDGILIHAVGCDRCDVWLRTPLAPKKKPMLLEPDFDLEEIELAEKLVANG